ncbi:hypothetical protein WA538_000790, partial [Blastocystis sp. DL]
MAELYYFRDIGRGEAIRIALDLSGISYVEKTIMPVDWPAFKEQGMKDGTLPFGQLPLLKIDGMNLVESSSILRYLSAKYISPDADLKMATTIDIMVEGWNDVISGYSAHLFNNPCALYSWIHKECDVLLSRLEAVYSRNNTAYFVSDDVTVVDCIAIAAIENLSIDYPEVLLQHPVLTKYMGIVINHPSIKRSLMKRQSS